MSDEICPTEAAHPRATTASTVSTPSAPSPRTRRWRRAALLATLALTTAATGAACVQPPAEASASNDDALSLTDIPGFSALFETVKSWGWNALFDGVWTNWYHRPKAVGLIQLAIMREAVTHSNLFDTYPAGVKAKYLGPDFVCAPESATNRTVDGTCNDPANPGMGAANVRFGRNVALSKAFPEAEAALLSPSPREVSNVLFTREKFQPIPFLNLLAASWIQFQVHDWFSHGDNSPTDLFTIPLAESDPWRAKYHMTALFVPRTAPDPTRTPLDQLLPPTYLNENTHWWDGSQIYGSDAATADGLRTHRGGTLKVDGDGKLPINAGLEQTGFRRNWWVGLSMMHTLFVREHNQIAGMLARKHPDWSDEQVYTKARMINAAVIAKIHTVEWTPAILPNETLSDAMNSNWYGLISNRKKVNVDPAKKAVPAPFGPALFGITANNRDLAGVPYSLSEEFVSVYRMHPLLPEALQIVDHASGKALADVPLPETRNEKAHALTNKFGMIDLFASFGQMHPGALVLNNYPAFLQDLSIPGIDHFDLGMVDVLRDRERGIPRYNEFRRQLKLRPLTSFDQISDDAATVTKLRAVYNDDIERLDLLVGCFAESHRPDYFGFGETTFQIFILVASRRLHGDRFFTDLYNANVYTQEGLDWVDDASMKSVLLRNYPELASTGLAGVSNAFAPWK